MKLGTLEGRHPLPVEKYILSGDVVPGQDAYDAAYLAAEQVALELQQKGEINIEVYYAGLTEVTLGCLDGLQAVAGEDWPVSITLMRFDAVSGQYQPLRRGLPSAERERRENEAQAVKAAAWAYINGDEPFEVVVNRHGLHGDRAVAKVKALVRLLSNTAVARGHELGRS